MITQGLKNMYSFASLIISPQEGNGAGTPRPRKDSAASSRIASGFQRRDHREMRRDVGQHRVSTHQRETPAHQAAAT